MSDMKQNIQIKTPPQGPLHSHFIRFTSSPFTGAATTAALFPRNPLNDISHHLVYPKYTFIHPVKK